MRETVTFGLFVDRIGDCLSVSDTALRSGVFGIATSFCIQ
jgi:hypothetical protein